MNISDIKAQRPIFMEAHDEAMTLILEGDAKGAVRLAARAWVALFNNMAEVWHTTKDMSDHPERLYVAMFIASDSGDDLDVTTVSCMMDSISFPVFSFGHGAAIANNWGGIFLATAEDRQHGWTTAVGHMMGVMSTLYTLEV